MSVALVVTTIQTIRTNKPASLQLSFLASLWLSFPPAKKHDWTIWICLSMLRVTSMCICIINNIILIQTLVTDPLLTVCYESVTHTYQKIFSTTVTSGTE